MGKWLDKTGLTQIKGLLATKFSTKVDKYPGAGAGKYLQTDNNGNAFWGDPVSVNDIKDATEDWLEANISFGTTEVIALDASLSEPGAAADAKSAGDLITVSDTTPTSGPNKLWIKRTPESEVTVPTYDEFTDLKSAFNVKVDNISADTNALLDFQDLQAYTPNNNASVEISDDNVTIRSLSNKTYCEASLFLRIPDNTDYLTISYAAFTGNGYGCVRIGASADNGATYSWKKAMTNASGDSYIFTCSGYTHIKVTLYVSFGTAATVNDYVTYSKLMVNSGIYVAEYTRAKTAKDGYARKMLETIQAIIGDGERETIFTEDAYYNYYNDTLTKMDGNGAFSMTGYEDLTGVSKLEYKLYKYIDTSHSRAVAYLVFFDENREFVSAVTDIENETPNGVISGIMEPPQGAKYVIASKANSQTQYMKLKFNLTDGMTINKNHIDENTENIEELQDSLNVSFGDLIYGYQRKINVIGDSITQGVGVDDPDNDSYVGLLRKMLFIENDMKMNWGFESFTMKADIGATVKMVDVSSRYGFSRTWNGTNCYGSEELSSSNDGAYILFTIRDKFNYMKVSYKDGVSGTFSVYAGETLLSTVTVSSGTVQAALTNAIDISVYGPGTVFKITRDSGTVTVSGVELGYNVDYPTFNNYGRAGIPIGNVTGQLLTKESDCNILIYALGVNGTVTTSALESIAETIETANPERIIVLSLCMKSSQMNNSAKISMLKEFADLLGATFIDMYSIIPKTDTYTDTSFFDGDGVHPSELGHRCIADAVSKKMCLSVQSSGLAQKVFGDWGS